MQQCALRDKKALVLAWEAKDKSECNERKDKQEFKEIHYCYLCEDFLESWTIS